MKRQAGLLLVSAILMLWSDVASAGCAQYTGRVATIGYLDTQPFFILAEYPSTAHSLDPSYTPERRRLLFSLLQTALVSGFQVQVLCNNSNPSNVLGVIVKTMDLPTN
ncbi:hypothetical protein [Bordetella flabilis]|uniref:Uncharacterized protein n=1 Tax=Bordetella flabilis TaxID=463014 RepID=A0A193GJT4_9BORD|nr:hypothetical protein [Bordetella flabilis]ANN79524.1 hypothetical protein BAU07_22525 [Bordetella flabilis]